MNKDKNSITQKICDDIMYKFVENKSKVGHVLESNRLVLST